MQYVAILGQNKELSLAELQAVYPKIKITARFDEAIIFESSEKIDITALGGLPKLAEVVCQSEKRDLAENIFSELAKMPKDKKIFFGLSFYGNNDKIFYNQLGKEIKKKLINNDFKVRWTESKDIALSPVYVKTNKLLTRGLDFCVFFGAQIYIAKTIEVQDFSDYGFRDMSRPARDLVSGIIPPKLAKILINLGGRNNEKKNFLDPFCGSGTFLMEATLLGFKKIYGSDISEKAVSDSKKNLDWLGQNYELPGIETPIIKKCDVADLKKSWEQKFDFIATEPYLGPAIRGKLNLNEAEILRKKMEEKYNGYLAGLADAMEKNGTLILIIPIVRVGIDADSNLLSLQIDFKKHGFTTARPSILYIRDGQKIGREIWVLKKF